MIALRIPLQEIDTAALLAVVDAEPDSLVPEPVIDRLWGLESLGPLVSVDDGDGYWDLTPMGELVAEAAACSEAAS